MCHVYAKKKLGTTSRLLAAVEDVLVPDSNRYLEIIDSLVSCFGWNFCITRCRLVGNRSYQMRRRSCPRSENKKPVNT